MQLEPVGHTVLLFDGVLVVFHHFLVHELHRLGQHVAGVGIHLPHAHGAQLAEPSHDVARDVKVAPQPVEPSPTTVCLLVLLQFLDGRKQLGLHPFGVEKLGNAPALFGLVLCIAHPGRFGEQRLFQFGILLQLREERIAFLLLRSPFPLVEHPLDGRVGIGQMHPDGIGVVAAEELLRALIRILHHVGQRQHRQPHRIGRELQRQRLMAQCGRSGILQLLEGEIVRSLAAHRQRHGLGHQHAVGQHRDGLLLSVRMLLRPCLGGERQCRHTFGNGKLPPRHGLTPFAIDNFRFSIFNLRISPVSASFTSSLPLP
jgi:hypothetical protein